MGKFKEVNKERWKYVKAKKVGKKEDQEALNKLGNPEGNWDPNWGNLN